MEESGRAKVLHEALNLAADEISEMVWDYFEANGIEHEARILILESIVSDMQIGKYLAARAALEGGAE